MQDNRTPSHFPQIFHAALFDFSGTGRVVMPLGSLAIGQILIGQLLASWMSLQTIDHRQAEERTPCAWGGAITLGAVHM